MSQWPAQQQGQQPSWPPQQPVQQPPWPAQPQVQQPQWPQPAQEQQFGLSSEQQQRRQFHMPAQPQAQQPQWPQPSQEQYFQAPTPAQQYVQQPSLPTTTNISTRKKRRVLHPRLIIPVILIILILSAAIYRFLFSPMGVALNEEKAIFHGDLSTAYSLTCPWDQHLPKAPANITIRDNIDDSGLSANIASVTLTTATVHVSGTVNITAPSFGSGPLKVDRTIQLEANGLGWCVKPSQP